MSDTLTLESDKRQPWVLKPYLGDKKYLVAVEKDKTPLLSGTLCQWYQKRYCRLSWEASHLINRVCRMRHGLQKETLLFEGVAYDGLESLQPQVIVVTQHLRSIASQFLSSANSLPQQRWRGHWHRFLCRNFRWACKSHSRRDLIVLTIQWRKIIMIGIK